MVDHVFVLCDETAPEAEALIEAGLDEGAANTHPGQGTACRRFFFRNLYLELLWVHDRTEAASESTQRLRLLERWVERRNACPFGVMLRSPSETLHEALPFPSWAYRPKYLPGGAAIDVAEDAPLNEPQLLHFLAGNPTDPTRGTSHSVPTTRVMEVRIGTPFGTPSSLAGQWLAESRLVSFFPAQTWLLELNFSMTPTTMLDFRPRLPLVIQYQAAR